MASGLYKNEWWGAGNAVPAGFRCHHVGKTLMKVFHCDIAEMRFAGKLVIMQTFS